MSTSHIRENIPITACAVHIEWVNKLNLVSTYKTSNKQIILETFEGLT